MYVKFYGLKERPFSVTSDPAFFFLSRKHNEAISHLFYGVSQRKGIIVITGEIGAGKTTICRYFLNQLDKGTKTAFILNPSLSDLQLLEAIVGDFGITSGKRSRLSFIWELNRFLLTEAERGNNVVLIIDEAQNLAPRALEQVRLLSNLETEKDKLLQIVLVGQPQLNNKLSLPELKQLQQRIMVRYHIGALDKEEVGAYIAHRLNVAGASGSVKFTEEAVGAVWEFSRGVPRLVNIICDRALLAGFVRENRAIDLPTVNTCAQELGNCLAESRI